MEIELTNLEISNILFTLDKITSEEVKGVRLKYRIGKIIKYLEPHHQEYVKSRSELIDEFAQKDEDGEYKRPKDKDGNIDTDRIMLTDPSEFDKMAKELSTDKIYLKLPTFIDVEDLEKSSVDLSVPDLIILEPILKEET